MALSCAFATNNGHASNITGYILFTVILALVNSIGLFPKRSTSKTMNGVFCNLYLNAATTAFIWQFQSIGLICCNLVLTCIQLIFPL